MKKVILAAFAAFTGSVNAQVGHNHCGPENVGHNHEPGPGHGNGHTHEPCDPEDIFDRPYLFNISTRAFVLEGAAIPIAGFIVEESNEDLCVVIRGRGPSVSLKDSSLNLPDPSVRVFTRIDGEQVRIAENNDWQEDSDQEFAINFTGLGDIMDTKDAGIFMCLPPGGYTAHLRSNDGEAGVGIIEVFDVYKFIRVNPED